MGFIEFINEIGRSFRDDFAFSYNYTCANCVKCKQYIQNLEDGTKMRVFTCPAVGNYDDSKFIDDLFSSLSDLTKLSPEYIDIFQKNRQIIDDYINIESVKEQFTNTPILDYDGKKITSLEVLQRNAKATTCQHFRPFINTNSELAEPDILNNYTYLDK